MRSAHVTQPEHPKQQGGVPLFVISINCCWCCPRSPASSPAHVRQKNFKFLRIFLPYMGRRTQAHPLLIHEYAESRLGVVGHWNTSSACVVERKAWPGFLSGEDCSPPLAARAATSLLGPIRPLQVRPLLQIDVASQRYIACDTSPCASWVAGSVGTMIEFWHRRNTAV